MDRFIKIIIKEIAKQENLNVLEVEEIIRSQFKYLRRHINNNNKQPIKFQYLGKFIFSEFLYNKKKNANRRSSRRLVESNIQT